MSKNYNRALEEIQTQLEKFSKTELYESSELVMTSTSIGKLLYSGVKYAHQKRFQAFLKGLCGNGAINESDINRLKRYINNEERAEFISDQINNVLRTHSKKATLIMGIKLYKLVEENQNPSYDDLLLLNALINLYDKDIINLQFLLTELERHSLSFKKSSEIYNPDMWFEEFQRRLQRYEGPLEEYIIDNWSMKTLDGLDYTVEKAISYNLLITDHDVEGPKTLARFYKRDYLPEYTLRLNGPGKELLEIIEDISIK